MMMRRRKRMKREKMMVLMLVTALTTQTVMLGQRGTPGDLILYLSVGQVLFT
jgi:hypothetical protein